MTEGNLGFIPKHIYRVVHQFMPIAALHLAVVHEGKVLLLRRLKDPVKDELWFPGGRLWRDEQFSTGARRLVREETQLEVELTGVMGVENLLLSGDPLAHGRGTHYVAVTARCIMTGGDLQLDANHSGHKWVDASEEELHPYVKSYVQKALEA